MLLLTIAACAGSTDDSGPPAAGGAGGAAGSGGAPGGTGGSQVFPSCSDGAQGESETDIDCGGNCPPCADEKACKSVADCLSKICTEGVCGGCSSSAPCPNALACVGGICQPCTSNADCAAGQACSGGKCGACGGASACAAGEACVGGKCGPCTSSADCGGGQVCESGACKPCASAGQCAPGQICQSGACGPCATTNDCPKGQACVSGACGSCTTSAQCGGTDTCVAGACGACTLSSQCGTGKVCDFGRCLAGTEVQMYQCPPSQSLGGGSWAFYGCQGQLASTSSCTIIEYPATQSFTCTPVGKAALVTATAPAAPGTQQVQMYQCPPSQSLGGGSWGFYGCQGQLASTPTCTIIEYPAQQAFNCAPAGKLSLSATAPSPPPGGKVVPMYQCPASPNLGGGSWGFYGCQSQLASTPTCTTIEYPSSQTSTCTAAGSLVLGP